MVTTASKQVLWPQVAGLATVQGAISLAWVIYNLYLLKLLTDLGFPPSLATSLLVIENILMAVMEPLMGLMSDQTQHWIGSRFPQIALGLILSAVCFVGIPIVFLMGGQPFRSLLIAVVVLWSLAMTVFRAPALSLLGRYAYESQLPLAASILTLVGGVIGAMAPLASNFILGLGPGTAFTVGSGVLLAAALVLRQVNPTQRIRAPLSHSSASGRQRRPWARLSRNLALVFGTGLGIAAGLRLLLQSIPMLIKAQVTTIPGPWVMGCVFLAIAVSALPCGLLATRWGNRRTMITGLSAMGGLCLLWLTTHAQIQAIGLALLTGLAFSLIANGTLPYALSMVPTDKSGLGTGLYFSGSAIALCLLGSLTETLKSSPLALSFILSIVGFSIAILCISSSQRWLEDSSI